MQFTDIFGQLKNVAITASQIEKAVNNEIMIDGSSIEGFVRIQESDQYLHPDLDTFTILPWRPQHGKVARLICDVYNPDGTPFIGDPRGALRRMLKKAADMGYSFNAVSYTHLGLAHFFPVHFHGALDRVAQFAHCQGTFFQSLRIAYTLKRNSVTSPSCIT